MKTYYKLFLTIAATVWLSTCGNVIGNKWIDEILLTDAVSDAAELVLVTPVRKMTHKPVGSTVSGASLNPLVSRSIRNFELVIIDFPTNTAERLNGKVDYNVFAWRLAARSIGNGEIACDASLQPQVGGAGILTIIGASAKTAVIVATFEPVKRHTLVTYYDSSDANKIVRMEFRVGKLKECP